MECFPVCKTCTGLCTRFAETPVRQPKRKKKTIAPRRMPGYVVMICGHYTTTEEQVVQFGMIGKRFPSNLTGKTKFYCSKCDRWVKPYTFSERVQQQTEQLPF